MSGRDGGPAFPISEESVVEADGKRLRGWAGMTLRDYFAGQAIQGMCATMSVSTFEGLASGDKRADTAGSVAYSIADAMLAARESEGR